MTLETIAEIAEKSVVVVWLPVVLTLFLVESLEPIESFSPLSSLFCAVGSPRVTTRLGELFETDSLGNLQVTSVISMLCAVEYFRLPCLREGPVIVVSSALVLGSCRFCQASVCRMQFLILSDI